MLQTLCFPCSLAGC